MNTNVKYPYPIFRLVNNYQLPKLVSRILIKYQSPHVLGFVLFCSVGGGRCRWRGGGGGCSGSGSGGGLWSGAVRKPVVSTPVLIYVHGYILARVIVKSLSVPLYRSYSVLFIGAHYLNQPALQK